MAVAGSVYQDWIATLTGADLQIAVGAGLDRPPEDMSIREACELREYDGLRLFLKNGSPHPLEHEATRTGDNVDLEPIEEVAEVFRAVMGTILRGITGTHIFDQQRTITCRLFMLARALQMAGCHEPSLAEAAASADVTRACLSKIGVELRDALGNGRIQYDGRERSRETMRQRTTESWKKRRQNFPDNS